MRRLAEEFVARAQAEMVDGAKQAGTKRILKKCLPTLGLTVDQAASDHVNGWALPACFGRHVIFASPRMGLVADMLEWPRPVPELVPNDDLKARAVLWATLAQFIYRQDLHGAMTTLATRLGADGIAQFQAALERGDDATGTVIIRQPEGDTQLSCRGTLVVLAGIDGRESAGVVGALPMPIVTLPGPVADWHAMDRPEADGWSRDGSHRLMSQHRRLH